MAWRRLVRRFRQKRIELVEALCDETAAPPSVMAYRIAAIEGAPVAVVGDVRFRNGGAYWVNSPNNWVWPEERVLLAWARPGARRPRGVLRFVLPRGVDDEPAAVMLDATLFWALQIHRENREIERWAPVEEGYTELDLDDYEGREWKRFRMRLRREAPEHAGGVLDLLADEMILRYREVLSAGA